MRVAIVSGKGGSGKSSISASLIGLSSRVVAVDCDVDASNLPLLFDYDVEVQESFVSGCRVAIDPKLCIKCGRCIENCRFGALKMTEDGVTTVPFLCEACGLCARLCPRGAITLEDEANSNIYISRFSNGIMVHGELKPGEDNSGKMIARMRVLADEQMKRENIDLQILDGPPGIGCPVLSTVTGIDRVVIVSEPTLSGLSDLKRIYQVSSSFCRDIMVIINKADINDESRNAIREFCHEKSVSIVAEIPFDRRLVESQIQRTNIVEYAPDSIPAMEIKKAYNIICAR